MSSVASPKRNLKGAPSQEELSERLRYLIGGSTMPQRQADEDEYEHEHEGFSQQPSAAISKRPIAFRPMHFLVIVLCVALAIGYSIFTAVNGRTQVIPESAEEVFTASTPEPTPEPKKISVSNGKEYCGHCGYLCEYARGYKKFYCIRCGGLNLRSWKN